MTITTSGGAKIQRKLDKLQDPKPRKIALEATANYIQAEVSEYPASGTANTASNGYSWYVRGFGVRTRTGRAYRTSENLDKRWRVRVTARQAVITNSASYSEYVHGKKQARWHRRRGWVEGFKWLRSNRRKVMGVYERTYKRSTGI